MKKKSSLFFWFNETRWKNMRHEVWSPDIINLLKKIRMQLKWKLYIRLILKAPRTIVLQVANSLSSCIYQAQRNKREKRQHTTYLLLTRSMSWILSIVLQVCKFASLQVSSLPLFFTLRTCEYTCEKNSSKNSFECQEIKIRKNEITTCRIHSVKKVLPSTQLF